MIQDRTSPTGRPRFQPPPPFVEVTPRWIRVTFGDMVIADSRRAMLMCRFGPGLFPNSLPTYYFPQEDVRMEALEPGAGADEDGPVTYYTVRVGERSVERGAWIVRAAQPPFAALQGMVSFTWDQMDGWYEEDEQVFVHARSPYHRVDLLASSRHVRVELAGVTLAETHRPYLLFETSLPTRYYIPRDDVRMELLAPTQLATRCPHKGEAQYWSATLGGRTFDNIVWSYPDPIPELPKIRGLLCFFDEQVDMYVDGELQPRPLTPWSEGEAEALR